MCYHNTPQIEIEPIPMIDLIMYKHNENCAMRKLARFILYRSKQYKLIFDCSWAKFRFRNLSRFDSCGFINFTNYALFTACKYFTK